MKKILALLAIISLGGCAVYPVGYYGPAPVYVAPAPVYVSPPIYYGYHHHRYWH